MWRGILPVLLLLLTGCQAGMGPAGPSTFSPEAEALAGRRAAPKLERECGGTYAEPVWDARTATVGKRLMPDPAGGPHPCQCSLLATDQVNAFSLPGGLIYITRGLSQRIGDDDGLLAAVIAHEMSHILRKDSLKAACRNAEESLDRESEADAGAVALLRAAGYDPAALVRLMELTADVQPAGWAALRESKLAEGAGMVKKSGVSDSHCAARAREVCEPASGVIGKPAEAGPWANIAQIENERS